MRPQPIGARMLARNRHAMNSSETETPARTERAHARLERNAQDRFEPVYRVLEDAIGAHVFPGCAFGVFAEGKVVLADALGRFTYQPESPAVEPETAYDLASVSKVVGTTAMAMLLWQRGQLDLDTLVADLLPGFVVGRVDGLLARRVRLRHLLAHSSGLPAYVKLFESCKTPAELLQGCLRLPLEAEPGTRAEYSDPGFILLGKALEIVAGETLDGYLAREVFAPLGMRGTGYCPAPALRPAIAPTEQDTWFRHRLIQGEVQDENAWLLGGVSGHAGLFSTVGDLLRFAAELLRGTQPVESTALFESRTVEVFRQREPPEGSSRAVGWDTPSEHSSSGRYFSTRSIGHLGYAGTSLWIDLEAGVAVVLLTNRTWPDRASQQIRQLRPAFHDAVRLAL